MILLTNWPAALQEYKEQRLQHSAAARQCSVSPRCSITPSRHDLDDLLAQELVQFDPEKHGPPYAQLTRHFVRFS
jgi:hypothetical protein